MCEQLTRQNRTPWKGSARFSSRRIEKDSLTSLQLRLVKTGGRLVKHARITGFGWRKDI
jgi:hypothetical protein